MWSCLPCVSSHTCSCYLGDALDAEVVVVGEPSVVAVGEDDRLHRSDELLGEFRFGNVAGDSRDVAVRAQGGN